MSKKIYVEGLALVEGHFSGIGQYILGMLRGMDELLDRAILSGKPVPKICVIIPYDSLAKFLSFKFKHIEYKRVPFSFRLMSILWHRGKMPPLDLWCGRGTYIFTRFVDMPLLFSKSYVIIYDLSYELHKQYTDDKNAEFLSKRVRKTIGRTQGVITISDSVKRELETFYTNYNRKILVAYPAAAQKHFYRRSKGEIAKVKNRYGIEGTYILALSNLEPRKNLDGLVEAYCSLPKAVTKNVGLLLVGVDGWKTETLFKKIVAKVEAGYNIMRPSHYVSDEDKPAIISGALALVYPSHYEGFGMPPLEALACGTPVIVANNSSLPEVVGNEGVMVDSFDIASLAKAIEATIKNETLGETILRAGPAQARKFNWATSAEKIIEMVQEI